MNDASRWRGLAFPWINLVYFLLIYGVPSAVALALFKWSGRFELWITLSLPLLWTCLFLLIAGALSLLHQFAITPGKFRRNVNNKLYFHRRLYGLCWTAVVYNTPVYYLCLSLPILKRITFRLFGYRGSMNFTVYPDTWIRDLPILTFEDGVYVSNRATLGTNIVLSNGFLLVQGITLREKALVGHLAMIAPGVEVGADAEIGVGAAIGIKTTLARGSFIGGCCGIGHGVRIGQEAVIGPHSYVGSGATVADGIKLPAGSVVASRRRVSDLREAEMVPKLEVQKRLP